MCVCVSLAHLYVSLHLRVCACAHVRGIGDVCLKCRSTKPSVAYCWMALLPDETERERERNREKERERERERERELRDRESAELK